MPDHRVFCPAAPADPAKTLTLSAAESHHLVTVNRARPDDPVVAFDGMGREWETRLAKSDRKAAVLTIESARTAPRLPCSITLIQAVPKGGGVMESIVRQATEMGVHRIVPLHSARTQVHWDEQRQGKKRDKWAATALEAAKQCGNPWLPQIDEPSPFATALPLIAAQGVSLVASLHPGAHSLHAVVSRLVAGEQPPRQVVWWVGPEGDFTAEEIEQLTRLGAQPVSLGPLVLRCDTAAAYAVAVISSAFNS